MSGVLYGIGVGPGAPDLLTLRAARILERIDVILCARSSSNDYSLALQIAQPLLPARAIITKLDFPMTKNQDTLDQAWLKAAEIALGYLRKGLQTAFLTIGDPLIYSTFGYLKARVKQLDPNARIEIIPGITSFQSAAATLGISLCEGNQCLEILPGTLSEKQLREHLETGDTTCILKVYRNFAAIRAALAATGRSKSCVLATAVEQCGQSFAKGAPDARPPYMSLILSRKQDV